MVIVTVPNATFDGTIVPPSSFGGEVFNLTATVYFLSEGSHRFIFNYEFQGLTASCDFTITVIQGDPCDSNPCLNGGICSSFGTPFIFCTCTSGFRGDRCEIGDPCDPNPCLNGGRCDSFGTTFALCTCSSGFRGERCEIGDPCDPNPCLNGGECDSFGTTFALCTCSSGFRGERCEIGDPCDPNPCLNGGRCDSFGTTFALCTCSSGFSGERCEIGNPCTSGPCLNGGQCSSFGNSFSCSCSSGFSGDRCEIGNPCTSGPCLNGGQCSSFGNFFSCSCSSGFSGDRCEIGNPCDSNPCLNGGICSDIGNNFACSCSSGFSGDRCEIGNPCDSDPCLNAGICSNDGNVFECSCSSGFSGDRCETVVTSPPSKPDSPAPLYLIALIVPLIVGVVIVVMLIRYFRKRKFQKKESTTAGEVRATGNWNEGIDISDTPAGYLALEQYGKAIYRDGLHQKPKGDESVSSRYARALPPIYPEVRQVPAVSHDRNLKESMLEYDDVDICSEGEGGIHGFYYIDNDRLEEYTDVCVDTTTISTESTLLEQFVIRSEEFLNFMKRKKQDVVKDILRQFMVLPKGKRHSCTVAHQPQNKYRNYSEEFLPYDHSRVKLHTGGSESRSDYINASYVKDDQGKISFIAAQEPQEGTVNDFWKMIWQEDVATIVMVTDRCQGNEDAPVFYWPSKMQTSEIYDDITVLLMESTSYTTHTVRTLNLFKKNQKVHHAVTHVQIHSWEYGYVPEDEVVLISIIKTLKTWQEEDKECPLLIHCRESEEINGVANAKKCKLLVPDKRTEKHGSGASGVIIALYVLMDVIKKEEDISVFEFVKQMRDDRVDMVQTNLQYFFIFEALVAAIQSTDSLIKGDQLQKLDKSSIDQRAKDEYQLLEKSMTTGNVPLNLEGVKPENKHKNRFNEIVPLEKYRPVLTLPSATPGPNDYVNATVIKGMVSRDYIITQSPLKSTLEDFWRLVYEYKCTLIVMLNTIDKTTKNAVQYWPEAGTSQYGLMTVNCCETDIDETWVHRRLQVNHETVKKPTLVDHFAFSGWSGNEPDISKFRRLITFTCGKGPGPVVVHCTNGVGLSAIYAVVASEIERMGLDGTIDVFQSVQRLRRKNPHAIQTQDEYTLCYQLLNDHLKNSEEYSVIY